GSLPAHAHAPPASDHSMLQSSLASAHSGAYPAIPGATDDKEYAHLCGHDAPWQSHRPAQYPNSLLPANLSSLLELVSVTRHCEYLVPESSPVSTWASV